MSSATRVLIVDDSALVREVLKSILRSDEELQLIGEAGNGREALELTEKLHPDVIIMDVDMPELSGLEATEKIMAYWPTPILILTSMDSAGVAFEALSKGALEVMEKPELDDEKCRELLDKVKLSAGVKVVTHIAGRQKEKSQPGGIRPDPSGPPEVAAAPRVPPRPSPDSRSVGSSRVIGIGSSTGGPRVLGQILSALPADLPASILIVQHITDGFVPILTTWLNGGSQIRVKEAEDGERLAPGVAYIAPSNVHMEVAGSRIVLSDGPPLAGHRPSADVLLSSVAKHYGKKGMGIVLSGMGRDGARGAREIRDAGGYTMAQDEATCVVFGMPKAALELDGVDRVLDPQAMVAEILHQVQGHTGGE